MLRNSAMPGSLYLISILHYIKLRIHFVSSMPPLLGKFRDAMADGLLELVRGLWLASPDLGPKPLLAKLREQQPDLGAGTREVCEVLVKVLKAEGEAKADATAAAAHAAAAAPHAAAHCDAPSNVALSLACIGCFRLPSDMDDEREKHPICGMCQDEKLPTTYQCGKDCPANPGAWALHGVFHKKPALKTEGHPVLVPCESSPPRRAAHSPPCPRHYMICFSTHDQEIHTRGVSRDGLLALLTVRSVHCVAGRFSSAVCESRTNARSIGGILYGILCTASQAVQNIAAYRVQVPAWTRRALRSAILRAAFAQPSSTAFGSGALHSAAARS